PSINREAPSKRYHWTVLPQGMKLSPVICQWYVASLLSPIRTAVEDVIIFHYMDDILICAPTDDLLTHVLDLTINALIAAGFELQQEKIQRMPPWKYLELSSPRSLTPEAQAALERIQETITARQAHRYQPGLPFKFIILGKLPHLHGLIFQWDETLKTKGKKKDKIEDEDQDEGDCLLIIEWVFLSHHRSKRMTQPSELVAELIRKGRSGIRELAGCDFDCIHLLIKLDLGQLKKKTFEKLLQVNEMLQFALDSYTGQIAVDQPAHKLLNSDNHFSLSLKRIQSRTPLNALTIFTDASGASHKSVMTWKDPQTQRWVADVTKVEGSPQVAELDAVIRAFERFSEPFNLVTDSSYVAGVVSRAEEAVLQEVSNIPLYNLLSKLVTLVSCREQPFYVMHVRSHTN
ncbi:POK8 protein, partial [Pheucticus melanocephalus]|nr:POK8 protein [Pheucticus melanocephalus]